MARTTADLVNRALEKIGAKQNGETAATDDYNTVANSIQGIVDGLAASDLVYIADINAIDDMFFEPLADIVAQENAPSFSGTTDVNLIEYRKRQIEKMIPYTAPPPLKLKFPRRPRW